MTAPDDDPYAPTMPYYDLVAIPLWEKLGPALSEALSAASALHGPVIDLGAGTGRSTLVIADALPEPEILAIEPSASMRAMLYGHLALRPDLHHRVTVIATDVAGLDWPHQVSAVVACNMIGHLDATARAHLWARLAEHLAPAGLAVVGLQPPSRPQAVPPTLAASVRVGRHTYQCNAEAHPAGPRSVHWTMTYRTLREDILVNEVFTTFQWWTVSPEDIHAEARTAGLSVRPADADLLVLRRR